MDVKTRTRVQVFPSGESRTKQAFAAECDINTILAKYAKTGLIEHVKTYGGFYGDLPNGVDFQAHLNAVIAGQDAFDSLPAKIRDKFYNDPAKFLAFVDDPDNAEEMVSLGLREQSPSAAPADPPVASTGAPVKSSPGEGEPSTEPAAPAT